MLLPDKKIHELYLSVTFEPYSPEQTVMCTPRYCRLEDKSLAEIKTLLVQGVDAIMQELEKIKAYQS